jgi:GNAT superfamily N-acetyltransferase
VTRRRRVAVRIRKLAEDDIDGICALWKEFARLREGMTQSKILNEDAADYFFGYATGLLQRKDTLTLVAEENDGGNKTLVGYVIASKQRRPPIYRHTKVAYLSDAFVSESHRGQGILKQFMAELKKWSLNEGITAVDVQLFDANKEAQAIYKTLGFNEYRVVFRQEIAQPTPGGAE